MRAGDYADYLEWRRRTGRTRDGHGQPADTFEGQGHLWCAVEDLAGGRAAAKESSGEQVAARVRARNYPAVAAGDRLIDAERGDVWTVGSVVRGDNELLLDVTRDKWTAGGGAA